MTTSPTRVQIKDIRFNYTNGLFAAQKPQTGEGKAKFNVVAIGGKQHPQLAEIKAAILAAAETKWPGKGAAMVQQLAAQNRICLQDGDGKADKPGYAGNWFINASNELRPLVVGPQREPLVVSDGKPYPGSYGNMIVEFWAQDNQFGKRINASLLGVQHVKDGERLAGGGVAAADDFDAIPEQTQTAAATSGKGAASLF